MIIITVISSVMTVNIKSSNDQQDLNIAMKTLGQEFNKLQGNTIINNCESYINLGINDFNIYQCNKLIKNVKLAKGVQMTNNLNDQIRLNHHGNLSNGSGTITFTKQQNTSKMIFSIGEGRYRFEK